MLFMPQASFLNQITIREAHPGVLVAKVGYFDPKSAKVPIWADMGTKPAKVGHLAATLLKYVPKKQKNKTVPPGGSNTGRLI